MIILRFIHEGSIFDKAIQWYSRSPWNHVDLCYGQGYLGARIQGGVQIRKYDYCTPARSLFMYADHLTDDEEKKFWFIARQQIGVPYNWRGIADFVIGDDYDTGKTFFCSQYVDWLFKRMGKPLLRLDFTDRCTPAMLTTSLILKERI